MVRKLLYAVAAIAVSLAVSNGTAQTTAGTSTTIVVPIAAQTASFVSEITVFNPNGSAIDVAVSYYDANNLATAGPKTCGPVNVPANRSVQFALAGQCTLEPGSHFGLLVLTEQTQTLEFHGYVRTQSPQGIGFSTEGFPAAHFSDALSHATGLKRSAAGGGLPAFQTNCFVGSLGQAVNYQLRLFNGATGAQVGSTVSGALAANQQIRFLDVFGPAGVNAPAGNLANVRAEFTNLTGGGAPLIGFCTVQENQNFAADFRIAKSFSAALGGGGTVTSVGTGTGLTGGPITSSGTISVATGSGPAARLGAVAFIHRFGSTLNPHLHFHCVVIDGVFDAAAAGGVVFHAATGIDADAIAAVQACVRRRLLRVFVRRGLLPGDDAQAMAQWQHGGGFSVDGSVRIEAADRAGRERLLR